MNNFKKGDKIRIKDEVSSDTHRSMSPYFYESMDSLKDKVLTFSGISPLGNIVIEEARWVLHPYWVEPVKEFKKGDKIRIKDEVSSETHREQFPFFMGEMEELKDKVLTFRSLTDRGTIKVEDCAYSLHPDWVTHAVRVPEDDFESAVAEIIKRLSEELSGDDSTSILEEAQEILGGARESDYGDPVANFNRISRIASSILGYSISPEECVVVMMAVKLSREQYKHKRDNLVDLVAYTEIYNRIKEH